VTPPGAARRAALGAIRLYQAGVSPLLGTRCRYEPSCSAYAYTAIERFGVLRGSWMGLRRLLRCRPGVDGGYDPLPERPGARERQDGARHVA